MRPALTEPCAEGTMVVYRLGKSRSQTVIREGRDFACCVVDVLNDSFNVDVACAHVMRAADIHYQLTNSKFTPPVWCPGCNRITSRRSR